MEDKPVNNKDRKTWEKPYLVILTRYSDGEYVLAHCKTNNNNFSTANGKDKSDKQDCASVVDNNCSVCSDRGVSGGS
jgi:hypothetical protein